MPTDSPQLSAAEVFTLLFVMLGPLKFLGPFVAGTRTLDDAAVRSLAVKATIMASVTVIAGAFVGKTMMQNMGISLPALLLAAGVVFFLVSLKLVMAEYEHAPPPEPATPLTAFETAFPLVATPYGMAGVIALLVAAGEDSRRVMLILGIVLVMMVLDLVFMIYARAILKKLGLPFRLFGAVLGIIMLGLAVELILDALRRGGIVS
jgi:multiple antibiotic resistance protein